MAQKNETPVLIFALCLTLILLGVGGWWFSRRLNLNLGPILQTNASPPDPSGNSPSRSGASPGSNFSQIQNVPAGLFSYGGSTSWAPIRLIADPAIQSARPEFRLRYVDPVGMVPSSGAGIRMLLDGQISFAQSSRPVRDREYQQAKQRGFTLTQTPVAIDGIAVAVNPQLKLPGLTLDQLKAIYTGRLTNWRQVGGENLAIVPFSRPVGSGGTVDLFIEAVLTENPFGSNVQFVSTTTEALRQLAKTPGGIYFASAPEVVPQCTVKAVAIGRKPKELVSPFQKPLVAPSQCPAQRNRLDLEAFRSGRYPLTRSLFVVIKQNSQVEQQAGEAYANFMLTEEGQEFVNRAGFVSIR